MAIQNITDLSEDQENERYNRLKKSLPKLAAASLAIALAVYFSYSSSPWRYALIVVLASAAVLLIAGAIMARPVKTEESSHTIDLNLITDSIRNSINESNERMRRIMNEEATRNLIDRNLITDSIRNSINESNERMHRIMNEEAIRNLEYERSRDFLREYNPHIYNFRASDFILREVIQRGNELHELTSKSRIKMFLRSDNRLLQMEEILSGNNRFYTHDIVKRMVNERDHNGNTPLHNAVRSEFLPAIRLLFEHGADCFIQNKKGQTPYGLSSKSDLVQDLFQNCSSVKEKIKEQREQQYSHNINKLLNIPQIKSKLCKNEKPYRKVPNCEGACSTLQELSVNKILDSCCLGG